jgi:hypothetical protein
MSTVITVTGTFQDSSGTKGTYSGTVSFDAPPPLSATVEITPATGPAGTVRTLKVTAIGGVPPYTFDTPVATGIVFTPVVGQPNQWTFVL